jgi:hypothetical protein
MKVVLGSRPKREVCRAPGSLGWMERAALLGSRTSNNSFGWRSQKQSKTCPVFVVSFSIFKLLVKLPVEG